MSVDWTAHRREAHAIGRMHEYLRQITYGGNDGIVTTFAVVAGFAGAEAQGAAQLGALAVLIFGLANIFADGVSMGLGEFLSARSERDLYNARRTSELREIAQNPTVEHGEVIDILKGRGFSADDATATADIMLRNPAMMADLMMTYEFGMADPREESPAANGLFTFLSFVGFGVIPLSPYFVLPPEQATFYIAVVVTLTGMAALGFLRWHTTREPMLRCVGENVLVGAVCAIVAFAVGQFVGG